MVIVGPYACLGQKKNVSISTYIIRFISTGYTPARILTYCFSYIDESRLSVSHPHCLIKSLGDESCGSRYFRNCLGFHYNHSTLYKENCIRRWKTPIPNSKLFFECQIRQRKGVYIISDRHLKEFKTSTPYKSSY